VREVLGVSERRACRTLGQHRSTQRKIPCGLPDEERLTEDIIALTRDYGRYGYRMIAGMLNNSGWHVNHKRVERIWRREGLKVPHKQKKKGRLWLNDGSCVRLRAERPNHVWSYDFVHDRTHDGRAYRTLNIIDEYTREAVMIRVDRKLNSTDVVDALTDLFILRGAPEYIRSDNVLYAELLAGLASGHYRIEVSRHVHSMAQFGFLVNDSLSHNKHRVRFCGSHRP
jgi:putative transposase